MNASMSKVNKSDTSKGISTVSYCKVQYQISFGNHGYSLSTYVGAVWYSGVLSISS